MRLNRNTIAAAATVLAMSAGGGVAYAATCPGMGDGSGAPPAGATGATGTTGTTTTATTSSVRKAKRHAARHITRH